MFLANDLDGSGDGLALFQTDRFLAFAIVRSVVEGVGLIDTGLDGEDGRSSELGGIDTLGVALAGVGDGAGHLGGRIAGLHILNFHPSTRCRHVVILRINDCDVNIAPCILVAGRKSEG